jgi:molybdate transport system substrate-binding protein
MRFFACAVGVTIGIVSGTVPAVAQVQPPIRIAAASDLAQALGPTVEAYVRTHKDAESIAYTFGSSGLFAKQLREGAPFDIFLSADLRFVDDVIAAGVCEAKERAIYARGRLVLAVPRGPAPPSLAALAEPRFRRVAIANPDHAPYGRAAIAALTAAAVVEEVKPKLVYADSVSHARAYVSSGNAEAGLVARGLVNDAPPASWVLVDARLHPPIDQALTVCGRDAARLAAATAFVRWLRGPAGRAALAKHGFEAPP